LSERPRKEQRLGRGEDSAWIAKLRKDRFMEKLKGAGSVPAGRWRRKEFRLTNGTPLREGSL